VAAGAGPHPAAAQPSGVPIIDVHVHVVPARNMTFDAAAAAAVQTMDRFGVARSIVMPPPRGREVWFNFDYPDFRATLARHPGRFGFLAGGGSLNVQLHGRADPAAVTEAVARDFAATARRAIGDGAIGFGEMSALHVSLAPEHAYDFVPADHPLLLRLADVAAELDVPIDLHMDALAAARPPPERLARLPNNPPTFPATLDALEKLLAHNRKARIVWAHGGSDQLGDLTAGRVLALMDGHPNLFMSLRVVGPAAPARNKLFSGPQLDPDWLSALTRHADRFVIGTDSFYVGPNTPGTAVAAAFARFNGPKLQATVRFLALLPRDLAERIAWRNAARIYRIDGVRAPPAPAPAGRGR